MLCFIIPAIILFFLCPRKSLKALKDKHVVITGGSSGIGKCLAIEAAKLGANITIIARDVNKLESAKTEIMAQCSDKQKQLVSCVSLDLSDETANFSSALEVAERDLGPIYMLINCAGMAKCGKIEDMKMEDVKFLMDLNFFGTYRLVKAVLPEMKKRKEGKIVIVGSQASLIGIFGFAAYSSSKFALRGLAEALHMEGLPYNISVTMALPPDTDTPGFANEEKDKPMETRLISQSAGLFEPERVANKIMMDTMDGKFFSFIGFESYMLTTLCGGMAPSASWLDLAYEVIFLWIFKLVGQIYLKSFHRIIRKCMKEKDRMKKNE